MVKVLFFAKLREDLQCAELTLELNQASVSFTEFLQVLEHMKGQAFVEQLTREQIVMAINHEVQKHSAVICAGDEVAFYPPVTGG